VVERDPGTDPASISPYSKKLITSEVRRIEMKEGKLPKRQYTQEFKSEAVRLAASVGGHEAARRLGVP
jgi:transposase-like protein